MRKAAFGFLIVGLAALSFIYLGKSFGTPAEAQRGASARIEYAVINGSYSPYPADGPSTVSSAVNICYLQSTGCQNEEIRSEINISKFLQDERLDNAGNAKTLAGYRAMNVAFSKAIAKLGAEGWEMVDSPEIEFDLYYTNPQGIQTAKLGQQTDRKHIWFKRYRQ